MGSQRRNSVVHSLEVRCGTAQRLSLERFTIFHNTMVLTRNQFGFQLIAGGRKALRVCIPLRDGRLEAPLSRARERVPAPATPGPTPSEAQARRGP